jgi:hypothetical protein
LAFWIKVSDSSILDKPNLILAGDFNLTLSSAETWGNSSSTDVVAIHFNVIFQHHKLIDLLPVEMAPTWRNEGLAQRVFLKDLMDSSYLIPSFSRLTDTGLGLHIHLFWTMHPLFSSWIPFLTALPYPYKFNPIWLETSRFCAIGKGGLG